MRLLKFAPLVFAFATVGVFATPIPRANGDQTLSGLKTFQAECVVTSTGTTCSGGQIGTATFTETSFSVGSSLGSVDGDFCFLLAESFMLTTPDGSTITFETSGSQCNGGTDYKRHNSYLITGGTNRFAGVTGAGNYVVSGLLPGFPATIHLDGNIQFP